MKKTLIYLILFFVFIGCQNNINTIKNSDLLIKEVIQYTNSKKHIIYRVYKDKNGLFYIEKNGIKKFKNLKFVKVLKGDGEKYKLQVIDSKNRKKILTIKSDIKNNTPFVCGTALLMLNYYQFEIKKDYLLINVSSGAKERKTRQSISLKSIKGVDKVFFINMKQNYKFNEFIYSTKKIFTSPYILIYKKNNKYGILGEIKTSFVKEKAFYSFKRDKSKILYDKISNINGLLLLEKDGLVGYYKTTDIKYLSLEPFDIYLSRFKSTDGKEGYINIKGNEYFDI